MTNASQALQSIAIYGTGNSLWLTTYLMVSQFYTEEGLPFNVYCIEDPTLEDKHPLITLDHKVWENVVLYLPDEAKFLTHTRAAFSIGECYDHFTYKNEHSSFHRYDSLVSAQDNGDYSQVVKAWYHLYKKGEYEESYEELFFPHSTANALNAIPCKKEGSHLKSFFPTGMNIDPYYSAQILQDLCLKFGVKIIRSSIKEIEAEGDAYIKTISFANDSKLQADLVLDASSCEDSPFAKKQHNPIHQLPYKYSKQRVILSKVLYPEQGASLATMFNYPFNSSSAFLPLPTLVNHYLATPNGYFILSPVMDGIILRYCCHQDYPEAKMKQEINGFVKGEQDVSLLKSFEINGSYIEEPWKANVIYLGGACYHHSTLFSLDAEILLSSILNSFNIFTSKDMNPTAQRYYKLLQDSFRINSLTLYNYFYYLAHQNDYWPGAPDEDKKLIEEELDEFITHLKATHGGVHFPEAHNFLSQSDFDYLHYGFKEDPFEPFAYIDTANWNFMKEKLKKNLASFASLCQNSPHQAIVLGSLRQDQVNNSKTLGATFF